MPSARGNNTHSDDQSYERHEILSLVLAHRAPLPPGLVPTGRKASARCSLRLRLPSAPAPRGGKEWVSGERLGSRQMGHDEALLSALQAFRNLAEQPTLVTFLPFQVISK